MNEQTKHGGERGARRAFHGRGARRAPALVALGALAVANAGCPPCRTSSFGPTRSWHFEDDCADALCGFAVNAGDAQRVDTLVAGEHGLRLSGGADVTNTFAMPLGVGLGGGYFPGFAVKALARCDEGTSLSFEQTFTQTAAPPDGGGRGADAAVGTPAIVVSSVAVSPSSSWSSQLATFPQSGAADAGATTLTALSLRIRVVGPGSCDLDDIVYGEQPLEVCPL